MKRQIICIDENKCVGCGLCAKACHEGAIDIVNGKAKLMRENFCDGFGDCLPACPVNAISFIEKETVAYDEEAVKEAKRRGILSNWPIQIKLAPLVSEVYKNASLLVVADCCGFAYKNIHEEFIKNRVTLIGCSKLDATDYREKLKEIIRNNDIKDITLLIMEVPCCGGLKRMLYKAIEDSGKEINIETITISINGKILNRE
ncbi:MAG: 4Fe-4S binding protein [Erysipelotrichaceae bacterium]|nr:4Fe-4S binding protein [Erysipelotrichaceae bacterium]